MYYEFDDLAIRYAPNACFSLAYIYVNHFDIMKNAMQTKKNSNGSTDKDAIEVDMQEYIILTNTSKTKDIASDSRSSLESKVYEDGHYVMKDLPYIIYLNDKKIAASAAYFKCAKALNLSKY